jgi:hypothetical protein
MQAIRTTIVARLTNDGTLYPGLVPGGVYDRPLKVGKDAGATPAAFWIKPGDAARIVRLRESIVVMGPNEVDPPDGPARVEGEPVLRNGFVRLFYYVPATASGKANLDAIDARVRTLLAGWQAALDGGYPATISVLELSDAIDTEEPLPGALMAMRRLAVEYLRPV